ncbi:DUF2633 domain-containing protein, partial [Salmonella enterica subsp. enterica serovar Enteritidis]|nr:DUF2633 domain-containing protein [Salmonella enterica subsp. enterica serovar Enteritidis]
MDPLFPLCLNIRVAQKGMSRKNTVSQATR